MSTTAGNAAPVTQTRRKQTDAPSPASIAHAPVQAVIAAGLPRYLQRKPADGAPQDAGATMADRERVPRYLQAGLEISQPGDVYEQEAERVADAVLRMPDRSAAQRGANHAVAAPAIQRDADAAGGASAATAPRAGPLSGVTQLPIGPRASAHSRSGIDSFQGAGEALPSPLHRYFATRMNADFGDVRIHHDTRAAHWADAFHARAFTHGNAITFAQGQYRPDTAAGKKLLAHELAHVMQQRGQSGRMVQRELALKSPGQPLPPGPQLDDTAQQAAIAYNKSRFQGATATIMASAEDIVGLRRDATQLDDVFVNAVARWQRWWNLPVDGRMTPMTTRVFASELRAEARSLRGLGQGDDVANRLEASAQFFDDFASAPLRDGTAAPASSAAGWSPPSGSHKLREQISEDFDTDLAAAAPAWLARAYVVRASTDLTEDEKGEYLAEIATQFSAHGQMASAIEVASLIDVVTNDTRTQLARALDKAGASAQTSEKAARDYLKALLRLAAVPAEDVPGDDPKAWLEKNTEGVGRAIRALESVLDGGVARQLSNSVMRASFTKDSEYTTNPAGEGSVSRLPKDKDDGNRLRADCDVYASYGMRLLRAQGWETVGFFAFQGETKDAIGHAVGLARRKTGAQTTEYAVVDSLKAPDFVESLGVLPDDETAKLEADKRGIRPGVWDNHYFAPPVGAGGYDPRLNTLHPAELEFSADAK